MVTKKQLPFGVEMVVLEGPQEMVQGGRMQQQMREAIDQVMTPQIEALDAKLTAGQAELARGLDDVQAELRGFQSEVVVRLDKMLEAMMRDRL